MVITKRSTKLYTLSLPIITLRTWVSKPRNTAVGTSASQHSSSGTLSDAAITRFYLEKCRAALHKLKLWPTRLLHPITTDHISPMHPSILFHQRGETLSGQLAEFESSVILNMEGNHQSVTTVTEQKGTHMTSVQILSKRSA